MPQPRTLMAALERTVLVAGPPTSGPPASRGALDARCGWCPIPQPSSGRDALQWLTAEQKFEQLPGTAAALGVF